MVRFLVAAAIACSLASVDCIDGQAATVTKTSSNLCTVLLEGPITQGDAQRLRPFLDSPFVSDAHFARRRLCLNSPGGDYVEGLKIAKVIFEMAFPTVVGAGSSCYSACALAFMAGNESSEIGKDAARYLHVAGYLGFHAPYVQTSLHATSAEELAEAFQAGVIATGKLLKLSSQYRFIGNEAMVPMSLVAELLAKGPTQSYEIDTVRKAIIARISLFGVPRPKQISRSMACAACGNLNEYWPLHPCNRNHPIEKKKKQTKIVFSVFVASVEEHVEKCILTVYEKGISIYDILSLDTLSASISLYGKVLDVELRDFFPPDTLIRCLPKRSC